MHPWILGRRHGARRAVPLALALALGGCDPAPHGIDDPVPSDTDRVDGPTLGATDPVPVVPLPVAAQVHRVSVALRQVRATADEVAAVQADPAQLAVFADRWSRSDAFLDQVEDLWAEVLHTRSIELVMPELTTLAGTTARDRQAAVGDEPLHLIREIVAEGRPFPDIFRTDWTVLDPIGMRIWDGHDGDPGSATGPTRVTWTDGRPAAGILGTNALWARHPSAGANYHRGRAAMLADAFLCVDFTSRDVPIDPSIDLSDPDAVAEAVKTDAACVSCHQALDPLAAHLWSVFPEPTPGAVFADFAVGCPPGALEMCYPATVWRPEFEVARPFLGLRAPSYWGQASRDLGTLAQHLADDPRFDQCAVQRMAGWLTQTDPSDVPFEQVARWHDAYVASDRDLRTLAATIATDPTFLAASAEDPAHDAFVPGPLLMRPRTMSSVVEALTGATIEVNLRDAVCLATGLNCYGRFEAFDDPFLGWHVLAGGTDGARTLQPTLDPTPMLWLAWRALAEEAAWHVVSDDWARDPADRRLLTALTDPQDDAAVRATLADLHGRLLGLPVAPDAPEIDALLPVLTAAQAERADPARAWADLVATMLRAPDAALY